MRKMLFIAVILAVLLTGCIPLMHKTIAQQVIRVDKNCDRLFANYKALLLEDVKPEDIEHETALIDATLLLTDDLKQSAETVLNKEK
jgi:hypothetical protein